MLKQTFLVLLFSLCMPCFAYNTCVQDSVAVETVNIKVTLTSKKLLDSLLTQPDSSRNIRNYLQKHTQSSKVKSPAKKPAHRPRTNPKDTTLTDTFPLLTEDAERFENSPSNPESTHKNVLFLLGLVLLIAGIIITLFFRTGMSLIIGIVFIVVGYYLLIYSWLFMT